MHIDKKSKELSKKQGFTIVELLVVIIIIAILATISVVVYSGIRKRAAYAAVQSEAKNFGDGLALYNAENGRYPTDAEVNCTDGPSSTDAVDYCFDSGYYIDYEPDPLDPDSTPYEVWPCDTSWNPYENPDESCPEPCYDDDCGGGGGGIVCPSIGDCKPGLPQETCPDGFIIVPGSARYGVAGFCVMKYEAKNVDNKAVSIANGTPWVNITQEQAISYSKAACDGCHLITEAEWMTLAQDIIGTNSNWSGGSVGSGYLFTGHSDKMPTNGPLAATNDDNNGYYLTGDSFNDSLITYNGGVIASMSIGTQKRTLELKSGKIIWDLSGNVCEWTSGKVEPGKGPTSINGTSYSYISYNDITDFGDLGIDISLTGLGISNINNSSSESMFLGKVMLPPNSNDTFNICRGGAYGALINSGILTVLMYFIDGDSHLLYPEVGFRVTVVP